MSKQAIIFGATGAVGRKLLDLCLDDSHYQQVIVIARKPAPFTSNKLQWIEIGFDTLNEFETQAGLQHGDAYCCLGTTLKTAGSKQAFRTVDYDYIVEAAKYAKRCGVRHFSLVSAIGANPSSISFYSQVKGEAEAALMAEQFSSLSIFRPSLLEGQRDEFRLKETLASWLSWLLTPVFFWA
ncbi:NAD(P)H-binding protein [Oceanicoccus sagamiensis]|uniref:NAD(P)-binding domain-containing protein n=1 Tax=Oceanicoccus sagamiensis TaxID=716816 RepID=A0A1X9N863_9GAMM|nr:NAD(P)H-binding protein [Oceanicoccus sagamiensis]ARN74250.1 hypothetical protein BST96_09035 [Oceanicoccus sagamiensis]